MKIGKGAIIGLLGGLLGLVGVFLPWASASAGPVTISVTGACLGGIGSIDMGGVSIPCSLAASGEGAIYAYGILAFSVLGLIFVILGKRSTSMLALIFGLLTIILAGVAIARLSSILAAAPGASLGYGIILCIVGGILLLLGSVLAMGEAKKAMMGPAPMPMAPPMPPPQ